jgi:hypothetical protein
MTSTITHEGRTLRIMAVDPAQAQKWLDTVNTRNRHKLPRQIGKYAKAMTEGRWRLVFDPLRFDIDGILIDGQNRLWAIIESGTTQMFAIAEGLEPDDQDVIDSGANRKAGQQLTIRKWKNGRESAAVVNVLLRWHTGTLLSGTYSPATDEVVSFAERYRPRVELAVKHAVTVRRNVPLLPAAVGAVAFTAYDLSAGKPDLLTPETVLEFFTRLATGADLGPKSPLLTLRNFATRRAAQGVKPEPPREVYNLVHTWNYWRRGEEMERLQVPRSGPITVRHITMT